MAAAAEAILLTAYVPIALHKRAKATSKRTRTSMTMLVRASLKAKLDQIDAEEAADKAQAARAAEPKRKASALVPLDQREGVDLTDEDPIEKLDRLSLLFEKHAQRIASVPGDNEVEITLRQQQAFNDIRALKPLSYLGREGERKMIDRLEALIADKVPVVVPEIVRTQSTPAAQMASVLAPDSSAIFNTLRAMLAPATTSPATDDPFVGKTINTTRVKRAAVLQDDDE